MNTITIIGLGAGDVEQMTLGVYKLLKNAEQLFLRTGQHPAVKLLESEQISYESFDAIYEKHDQFEAVYEEITTTLLNKAKVQSIVYAVPGHPLVAERTVQLLLNEGEKSGVNIDVYGGQSFLDPMFNALKIDPIEGFQLVDGTDIRREELQYRHHVIIGQVYDQIIASEVKLTLMESLPFDYEVFIVTSAGSLNEKIQPVPLYMLDQETSLNNLTSIYVPPVKDTSLLNHEFVNLRHVIAELRGPNGCPWDKKQTHASLKRYLIEEAYEVLEAIDQEDDEHIVEELGDVLLQIMLHAQIGEDNGYFSIGDIIKSVTTKMIRRHPHVFGNIEVSDAEEVVQNWEEIKKKERGIHQEEESSILDGIPKGLPSLYRAEKIQSKAAKVGFDWDKVDPIWSKIDEEIEEFQQEIKAGNELKSRQEFGDLLFAIVNLSRYYKIDPEQALEYTNNKFIARFHYMEQKAKETGHNLKDLNLEQLDVWWNEAKKI